MVPIELALGVHWPEIELAVKWSRIPGGLGRICVGKKALHVVCS